MTTYYTVTIGFDYTTDEDVDADELHDAIRESFDTIDLEFDTEVTVFDDDGNEVVGQTRSINVNCDNLRNIEVVKVEP